MGSRIDVALESARAKLSRLSAGELPAALARGAVLVDIRPAAQRAIEGEVPTALIIERNVLEWRCDPTSEVRLPQAVDDDVEWVGCARRATPPAWLPRRCRRSGCTAPPT